MGSREQRGRRRRRRRGRRDNRASSRRRSARRAGCSGRTHAVGRPAQVQPPCSVTTSGHAEVVQRRLADLGCGSVAGAIAKRTPPSVKACQLGNSSLLSAPGAGRGVASAGHQPRIAVGADRPAAGRGLGVEVALPAGLGAPADLEVDISVAEVGLEQMHREALDAQLAADRCWN